MMKQSVEEVLTKAKELILDKGWIQGEARSPEGFCTLGAVMEVSTFDSSWNIKVAAVETYLEKVTGADFIPGWNDEETRTLNEVIDAFDRALILAKEDHGTD